MSARVNLGQLVIRNWPIKLAARFIAIMLYVAVAAQQPLSQTFAMRLAVVIPPGRTVRQQPAGVTVVITGTGSEILKLRSFPRVIRKVIPDTFSTSLWRTQLTAADIELPKGIGVQIADIRPRDVEILLDSVGHKDVRIFPRVKVEDPDILDRKSTRLNSSHITISYAVFCLKKKKNKNQHNYKQHKYQRRPPHART